MIPPANDPAQATPTPWMDVLWSSYFSNDVGLLYVEIKTKEMEAELAAARFEVERLKAVLEVIEVTDYCTLHSYPEGKCPSCIARSALTGEKGAGR